MIDKLKLYCKDFEVINDSRLSRISGRIIPIYNEITKKTSITDTSNQILYECQGKPVCGEKAYINHHLLNLDISSRQGKSFLMLSFNPNKVYTGGENNLKSCGKNGLETVFKTIETTLKEIGIKLNPKDSLISRIDTNTDIITNEPFPSYEEIFKMIHCKREVKNNQYSSGYLKGNESSQTAIYNKFEESKNKNIILPSNLTNLMRFENRALKNKAVKSMFGFNQTSQIIPLYKDIKEIHKERLLDLFKHDISQIDKKIYSNNWEEKAELLDFMIKQHGLTKGIKLASKTITWNPAMDLNELCDFFVTELIKHGYSNPRMFKSRLIKEYAEIDFNFKAYANTKTMDFKTLYNEIKTKLLKAC